MSTRSKSTNSRRRLGKVVGGVYVVNAKKTVDPGASRRRRRRRDQGSRRSVLGGADPWVRTLAQAVTPSASHGPGDPRRKSRFIGHLVDGVLGWGTDLVHHVPIVGPLVGHPCRWVCRIVRAGEDAINSITGTVGVHLFVLALLSALVPCGNAADTFLTNCCDESQVHYCSELTCLHDTGCVICALEGNDTVCWTQAGPFISNHPNYSGVDPFLAKHIDLVAGAIWVCDLAAMHEVCGVVALGARSVLSVLPMMVSLNTSGTCYLLAASGVDPGLWGFLNWVAQETVGVIAAVDFLFKLPYAVAYAFSESHYLTIAAICGLALNGNLPKAVALVVLYVEAAVAAPVNLTSGWSLAQCSPFVVPKPCPAMIPSFEDLKEAWCFDPPTARAMKVTKFFNQSEWHASQGDVAASIGRFAARILARNQGSAYTMLRDESGKALFGWGCMVTFANGTRTCCALRTTDCEGCASDCSWLNKEYTYERCGTTPWLSTACGEKDWENGTCSPFPVAFLKLGDDEIYRDWPDHVVYVGVGAGVRPLHYKTNRTALASITDPRLWARLPFVPPLYRGQWYVVPKGMYSDRRDLATGLITKDVNSEDYQMAFTASGGFQLAGVTAHVILCAVLAALGARWCLFLYSLYLWIPGILAIPSEIIAATAATSWSDAWLRVLLYLLLLRWPMLSSLLSGRFSFACILFWYCGFVDAYTLADGAMALTGVVLTLNWLGVYSSWLPMLALSHSYLRWRLEFFMYEWSSRNSMFVCVLLFPQATQACLGFFWCAYLSWLFLGYFCVEVFAPKTKLALHRYVQALSCCSRWLSKLVKPIVVWAAGERGVFWYKHIDGVLEVDMEFQDPYFPLRTEVIEAQDVGRKLACGDVIKKLPVYARLGSTVRAGIAALPPKWKRTAPFSLRTTLHRGEMKLLAMSVYGTDSATIAGSIAIIGTAMSRWMGFAFGGYFQTAYHGCKGKQLATAQGPHPPVQYDTTKDVARYPLPKGMTCLPACTCDHTACWLVTRLGRLVEVSLVGDKFINSTPLTLKEAKGSSGAPVLCKCGGVKGMLTTVRSVRGNVLSLGVVPVEALVTDDPSTEKPWSDRVVPPEVPKGKKEVRHLVAPTGSGKSTKLPMHYYEAGYRVLVLNPSVATTASMPKFMHETYNVSPNCLTGDTKVKTGSRLTYSTYGMFLAGGAAIEADVIICDECHATDATTVLGIGAALHSFEDSPKGKLLILATATPPGTPITPHENITEIELDKEGEIPFHGKKIKIDKLKKGRHLIFQASKKHCEELAAELAAQGLCAVYYYRGRPLSVIPKSGDVVVVATDALMTGYTGNFDSVYDCCMVNELSLEVDMAPTFSVSIKCKPADTVTRMQRRGRTGRGRPGTYYSVIKQASANGTVPTATVYECFDAGLAWYGMTAAEVATALDFYREQSITPAFLCSIPEVQQIFQTIGYVPHADVTRMRNRVDNFVYLHAYQYHEAMEAKARPPNDDPRWAGLNGSSKFPVLYHLDKYNPEDICTHPACSAISACYEEYYASSYITLAGVGMSVAAVMAAVDLFGNCIIQRVFNLELDSTATYVTPAPTEFDGDVEECAFTFQPITELAMHAADLIGTAARAVASRMGKGPSYSELLSAFEPHLLAAIQYFTGLATMGDAPGVGVCLGFVGGMLSPLPLKANLFLSALGGAFAARRSSQKGAAAFALAGAMGSVLGATSLVGAAAECLSVYASSTSVALVVLKLCDGQMPSFSEWSTLIFSVTSPGGALIGAGAALLIAFVTRTENNTWVNRLLSMLNRGTTCDDYFVPVQTLRSKIIKLLSHMNVWEIFTHLSYWLNTPEDDMCACSIRSWLIDFCSHVGLILRAIVEFGRGFLRTVARIPGVPWVSCDVPYRGLWRGSGVIRSVCDCGHEGTWLVEDGKARPISVSKFCWSYLRGGVPINASFSGTAIPAPAGWSTMTVNNGFDSYVTYEKKGDEVWIVGVTTQDQLVPAHCPELCAAVAIDGVQIKPLGGRGWSQTGPFRVRVQVPDGIIPMDLPCNLKDFKIKEIKKEKRLEEVNRPQEDAPPRPRVPREPPSPRKTALAEIRQADAEFRDVRESCTMPYLFEQMAKAKLDEVKAKYEKEAPPQSTVSPAALLSGAALGNYIATEATCGDDSMPPLESSASERSEFESLTCPEHSPTSETTSAVPESSPTDAEFTTESLVSSCAPQDAPSEEVTVIELTMPKRPPPTPRGPPTAPRTLPVKPVKVRQRFAGKLPKVKEETPDTYSLASSSWETASSADETECSWSYVWSVKNLVYRAAERTQSAVRTLTHGMMWVRNQAYASSPDSINERVRKVTVLRQREQLPQLTHQFNLALNKVSGLNLAEWSLKTALDNTANRTAKSGVTGATAKTLKAGHTKDVLKVYDDLTLGKVSEPWNQVNIMPKSEVFVKTSKKPTQKPARIIAYPHLEMRVAEKMVLGEIGPATVKAVCGEAYGFQYTPKQRVHQLLKMWKQFKNPVGFTCDTVCFDSTITPADVELECALYCAAAGSNATRTRIRALHEGLYKGGPMLMQGKPVGQRNCRASGVFTTSSSNTMTCFLKVNAAADIAGLKNPLWLINGDDCVCISESRGHSADSQAMALFATAMKQMGAPQGEVPRPLYSLELLDSCSSNVSVAQTSKGQYHYLTRDPSIPLARASVEGNRFNPLGTWLGYILANYPAVWVSRILCVQFLNCLLSQDHIDEITFEWYGNNYTIPLHAIPYIIQNLHGKQCWDILQYTPREIQRVGNALQDITMKPLRYWKRTARQILAACRRRKGTLRFLGDTLLSWVHHDRVELNESKLLTVSKFNPFDSHSGDVIVSMVPHQTRFGLLAMSVVLLVGGWLALRLWGGWRLNSN